MQNRQFTFSAQTPRSRLLVAVITALAMLATSGMLVTSAEAQGSTQFVFQGGGWGHGVGMSQNGARNAADNGASHVQILNFYYPNTVLAEVPGPENIRVHIGDAPRVELSSEGSMAFDRGGVVINALPSGTISVSAHDGGLQIGNAWTLASPSDPIYVSFPQPVTVSNNGHRYLWGKLQLTNKDGEVRVVEVLPMEDYVAGIAEMPAAWPLEALMAQAIAARTYAHEVTLHRRNSEEWAQEYDISGSTIDQNYIGYDAQDSAWDQKWLAAVSATARAELVDSNGPIRAYYSATNGGYTETAAYVFNNDVPYTVAGPDPYDAGGHDWTQWTRTYSQESMSRWLNAHQDTAVGTLTAINVGGGAGASARIDKAVVELVGTAGTKRVTGKRLMLVMNSGIFSEGGGLSTHLPGTFTTIGNGAAAGWPQPTGAPVPTTATPDPVAEVVDENEDFTPPPGWTPEPGTGVAPGGTATADAPTDADADAAETVDEPLGTLRPDGTFIPPEGWEPEPGTGIAPGASAGSDVDTATVDSYTPPEGWEPEPGTGVAPTAVAGGDSDTTTVGGTGGGYSPPAGWSPEPGTGIAPSNWTPEPGTGIAPSNWTPEPGTGIAPSNWTPEPGTGVAPRAVVSASTADVETSSSSSEEPAETSSSSSEEPAETSSSSSEDPAETSSSSAEEFADTSEVAAAESTADSTYTPPEGWTPQPGTGVAPSAVNAQPSVSAEAGGVLLVTRTSDGSDLGDPTFQVIAPTADLAAESKKRLTELQTQAALGLFAGIDISSYVGSVAPQPVHAVCTATVSGVTCLPVEALQD